MGFIKLFATMYVIIFFVTSIIEDIAKHTRKEQLSSIPDDFEDFESGKKRNKDFNNNYNSRRRQMVEEAYEETLRTIKNIRIIAYSILTAVVIIVGLGTAIFFTNEQQIGVVSTFGHTQVIDTSGAHFAVPFLSQRHIFDSTIKGMPIGYIENTEENNFEDSLMITSDYNFINIDFYAEYRIVDPVDYCYGTSGPEVILKNALMSAIRNTVGRYDIDTVMTTGKAQIEQEVKEDVRKELEEHHTGLELLTVTVQDAEPPTTEVIQAFADVESARQTAEKKKNEAKQYENQNIPNAEAEAQKIVQNANAKKTERINQAEEEVAKFNSLYDEYSRNPETVKDKMYYDAMKNVLPKMDVIIGGDKTVIVKGENTNGTAGAVGAAEATGNEENK